MSSSGLTTQQLPPEKTTLTPALAQYLEAKRHHPDCLLFYRLGDFYELFFEDAIVAAGLLGLTLTRRGQYRGEDIPMCGVPAHAAESYLAKLIRAGHKVAICEQLEDAAEAKKRGPRSVVHRDVVRVITPGTLTEESFLEAAAANYLAAIGVTNGDTAVAWMDISTGAFFAQGTPKDRLPAVLARENPTEILLPETVFESSEWKPVLADWRSRLTPQPSSYFDSLNAERRLLTLYGVSSLESFGHFSRAEIAAAGALLQYVELTQAGRLPRINRLVHLADKAVLEIDAATRRNLELTQNFSGGREGTLLATIDRTRSAAGARRLAQWLAAPLTGLDAIRDRLDGVSFFTDEPRLCELLREDLRALPDIDRALSRLTLGRGGPRDLAAIRDGLEIARRLQGSLTAENLLEQLPAALTALADALRAHPGLMESLSRALGADLPMQARDGGFIARSFDPQLDQLRLLRDDSRKLILGLEDRYRQWTGITGLKIRHNQMLGYYIEVKPEAAQQLRSGEYAEAFRLRQGLANAARFTTAELSDLDGRIVAAADEALARELELFDALQQQVLREAEPIARTADALANLDVLSALADLAALNNYVRPHLDESDAFVIEAGRHPVVEAALKAQSRAGFIANSCNLSKDRRLWLVTGPNMAGKSTFLRQNALIAILAQMGSFVPAASAHIGLIDRLFSRVGAADDLARGRSTFMVEMVETAAILNQATAKSLVILDEIGRGTATYDGLSIAWASLEHLHEICRCRGLFATHFHELAKLTSRLPALSVHSMRVKEWQDEVIFLHEVGEGAADRSYGLHVARLAGLPAAVLTRAAEILRQLEAAEREHPAPLLIDDLPLFATPSTPASSQVAPEVTELLNILSGMDPDALTPKAALETLYRLCALAAKIPGDL